MVKVYTDGSCNPQEKIGSWVGIIINNNNKIILKGVEINSNHNQMELLAVINAVKYINMNIECSEIVIITDSQYVKGIVERKNHLKETNFITKKGNNLHNSDLLTELIYFIENQNLKFTKIKAHQKINPESENINIEADRLSRKLVRNYLKENS